MATVIGYPIVNAGVKYINGLNLVHVDDENITVKSGSCRDSTNKDDIILSADANCDILTNGIGGLDTGSVAASTFYAVHIVASSLSANPVTDIQQQRLYTGSGAFTIQSTPSSDVSNNPQPGIMFSLSATAPTLPLNYDMFRRIGYVLTDGSSDILAFWQTGGGADRTMWYDALITELSGGTSATFAAIDLATSVPVAALGGTSTDVIFNIALTPTGADDTMALRPTGSASVAGFVIMGGDAAGVVHTDQITCPCAISASVAKVDYLVTGAVTISTAGYVDKL